MREATGFFLILNLVSILVRIQEPEEIETEDWITDFISMASILAGGAEAQTVTCASSETFIMMNSSSKTSASEHREWIDSVSSEYDESS